MLQEILFDRKSIKYNKFNLNNASELDFFRRYNIGLGTIS